MTTARTLLLLLASLSLPVIPAVVSSVPHGIGKLVRLSRISNKGAHRTRSSMRIEPASDEGIILAALADSRFIINGEDVSFRRGEYRQIHSHSVMTIVPVPGVNVDVLVINIVHATQPLTVNSSGLQPGEEVDDASSRNTTLVVAISPLSLTDEFNRGTEAEWSSGHPRVLAVPRGAYVWLRPGIHHIKNRGQHPAEFITVEW